MLADLSKGVFIKNKVFISWNTSYDKFVSLCTEHNIDFAKSSYYKNKLKCIETLIDLDFISNVRAFFFFKKNRITVVSISKCDGSAFDIEKYKKVEQTLLLRFGDCKACKKTYSIWKFNKITLKHFYEKRDEIINEYLELIIK